MTRRLFWEDAYAKEFDAKVVAVEGNQVVLDQTAFNPRGGGLVGDIGTLNGVKVLDTVKIGGDSIAHVLEPGGSWVAGNPVHGVLDWERRHRIMRMHTSAHLLSAIFNKETGALITGNQIEPSLLQSSKRSDCQEPTRQDILHEKRRGAQNTGHNQTRERNAA
jgi:Ser-tRNA(Ala) deacylase AlaX